MSLKATSCRRRSRMVPHADTPPVLAFLHGRGIRRRAGRLCADDRPSGPPATAATGEPHVARARQIAGDDLRNLMRLCQPQPAERATPSAAMDEGLRKLIAKPAPPPMKVFDNLYFVGGDWVSAWVLETSEGLILIDA
jgi:metallo-beta-lactamase class B